MKHYTQLLGWRNVSSGESVIKIHICGYQNGKILYQAESGGKIRKRMIRESSKGKFFIVGGKRFYLMEG